MQTDRIDILIRKFLKKHKGEKILVVLLGPTASGKTALSLLLAKKFNGEIISADSRQIYRGMDIGTDKIPKAKRQGIPHHLINIVTPEKRFTVADFKKLAEEKIEDILSRGKIPFLAGGTGLYIRAIAENFRIPETGEDISTRKKLEQEAYKKNPKDPSSFLHQKLKSVDPASAKKIHPKNMRYILRALEIFYRTGKPKKDNFGKPKYRILKIGIKTPKEILHKRIHRRVEKQFQNGLVQEVKKLLKKYSATLPALQTLGYQELIPAIRGRITADESKELIKIHTRQFSRRQMTWFKKEKGVTWIML